MKAIVPDMKYTRVHMMKMELWVQQNSLVYLKIFMRHLPIHRE